MTGEVIWEPPAAMPEKKAHKWRDRLIAVKTRPGHWGRMETYRDRKRARRAYHYLKDRHADDPAWEFSYSAVRGIEGGQSTVLWGVYGRWNG